LGASERSIGGEKTRSALGGNRFRSLSGKGRLALLGSQLSQNLRNVTRFMDGEPGFIDGATDGKIDSFMTNSA
jgi:hypothetical protein